MIRPMRKCAAPALLCLLGCASAAIAQPIALEDLAGSVIETRVVIDRMVRKSGETFASQLQLDDKVTMHTAETLQLTSVATSRSKGNVNRGAASTSPIRTIGQTQSANMGRGEGHGVWIYEEGRLVQLRTYKSGALKRTITFTRKPDGIGCAVEHRWVLEEGKRTIEVTSGVDGLPLTILSFKQTSSTCRLNKKGA
jgi:hypothetical protein